MFPPISASLKSIWGGEISASYTVVMPAKAGIQYPEALFGQQAAMVTGSRSRLEAEPG